jgi:DNA-binding transcriptional LysR family regulator
MDRFVALSTFVAVAERNGFAPASRHLGMSPPTVTRTIAALERHLGVSLFRRSTRSVALTEEGAAFLERARDILTQLQEAEHAAMGAQAAPHGALYVTAPVVFGRLHVLPVTAGLLAAHQDLSVRLLLLDRNIRLVEEGIDVAVRIGGLPDSTLRAVAIGTVRQVLVASPGYCERRGRPAHPRELALHDIIAGDNVRTGTHWRFGTRSHVAVTPRLTVTSIDAQLAAAAAGLGIANVLTYQAADGLAAGTLCSVLDEHAPAPLPVHLVYDVSRARLPAVRLFIESMRDYALGGAWT